MISFFLAELLPYYIPSLYYTFFSSFLQCFLFLAFYIFKNILKKYLKRTFQIKKNMYTICSWLLLDRTRAFSIYLSSPFFLVFMRHKLTVYLLSSRHDSMERQISVWTFLNSSLHIFCISVIFDKIIVSYIQCTIQ